MGGQALKAAFAGFGCLCVVWEWAGQDRDGCSRLRCTSMKSMAAALHAYCHGKNMPPFPTSLTFCFFSMCLFVACFHFHCCSSLPCMWREHLNRCSDVLLIAAFLRLMWALHACIKHWLFPILRQTSLLAFKLFLNFKNF